MRQLFQHAIAEGLLDDNPVDKTLARDVVVKRRRLTYEAFQKIREHADPWYRNALDLALQTLQRREDLVEIKFTMGPQLELTQSKTGTAIAIDIGPELAAVIKRCRDDVPSPYLIHRKPKRKRKYTERRTQHWTQVSSEMLTRQFAAIRDAQNLYPGMDPAERPSFHEIRSLGAEMYRQTGMPEPEIQRLLGHRMAAMTAHYLDGHDTIVRARAGLKLPDEEQE